jgi:hypothetical protein
MEKSNFEKHIEDKLIEEAMKPTVFDSMVKTPLGEILEAADEKPYSPILRRLERIVDSEHYEELEDALDDLRHCCINAFLGELEEFLKATEDFNLSPENMKRHVFDDFRKALHNVVGEPEFQKRWML